MADLDAIDRRILSLLQTEGRISNAELALRVHLSPSACHRRVQRLEEAGVISGYVALLDARALRRQTTVFVEITLSGRRTRSWTPSNAACAPSRTCWNAT